MLKILPRIEAVGPRIVDCGDLVLYPDNARVKWKGVTVPLTVLQYKMIEYLAQRDGLDASFRDLYSAVRGEGFVAGDGDAGMREIIRSWISRIRRRFRSIDSEFDQIEMHPGFGYRWRNNQYPDNVLRPAFTA